MSAGSLFIAILVTDLVLLQTVWRLLNWVTIFFLERKDLHANLCEGCMKQMDPGIELRRTDSATATVYSPVPDGRVQMAVRSAEHVSSESQVGLLLSP
jgi:hypothetical protein